MEDFCQHQVSHSSVNGYYFFTWTFRKFSSANNFTVSTEIFKTTNGVSYTGAFTNSERKIAFWINSDSDKLKCSVSMIIGLKTLLLSNCSNSPILIKPLPIYHSSKLVTVASDSYYYYELATLTSEDESFRKLKDSNCRLAIVCKIIYNSRASAKSSKTGGDFSNDSFYNLRPLANALKSSPESLLKEKVTLSVVENGETVSLSKAVLCSQSPVFTKMFEHDSKEANENLVVIDDIEMPVLKVLVSFLYTGKLPNLEFNFACDLYYAADKYEITELLQICVDSLIPQISMENVHRVMKLAFSHNDELLKSTVTGFIATNIEMWFSTDNWKNLVDNQPNIAAEVLTFFDF